MTPCTETGCALSGVARDGGRAGAPSSDSLNGTAARRTKKMTGTLGARSRPGWPWGSIAIALVAVASVLGAELWALHAPATKSEVMTELNGTLARVVAGTLLISPAD